MIFIILQDKNGRNLGMWAATYGLEKATLKALDNKQASLQQDVKGRNIGMYAAKKNLKNATIKALQNAEASIQYDKNKKTILGYANKLTKQENKDENELQM